MSVPWLHRQQLRSIPLFNKELTSTGYMPKSRQQEQQSTDGHMTICEPVTETRFIYDLGATLVTQT